MVPWCWSVLALGYDRVFIVYSTSLEMAGGRGLSKLYLQLPVQTESYDAATSGASPPERQRIK